MNQFSKKDEKRIERILLIIKKKPKITNEQLSDYLDYNLRLTKDLIRRMKENNIISIQTQYKRVNKNKQIFQFRIMKDLTIQDLFPKKTTIPVGSLLDTKNDVPVGSLLDTGSSEERTIPVGSLLDTKVSQSLSKDKDTKIDKRVFPKEYLKLAQDFQLDLFNWLIDKFYLYLLSQREKLNPNYTIHYKLEMDFKYKSWSLVKFCKTKEFANDLKNCLKEYSLQNNSISLDPLEILNSEEWRNELIDIV